MNDDPVIPVTENVLASPRRCPACGVLEMELFYCAERVPVHSVLLFNSRNEAIDFPKAAIRLGICGGCGFISNVSFDSTLLTYSRRYESTQTYSDTFVRFQRRLAESLVAKYKLHRKSLIEIGCGNGEFLALLCELGGNRGVGYDPAAQEARKPAVEQGELVVIPELYTKETSVEGADLVCCLMTLEHIPDVAEFVGMIRGSLGANSTATLLIQVPNVRRILRERAFWDIYFEHCSYFSPGLLARLLRRCGFVVTDVWTEYDDQYTMLEAVVADAPGSPDLDRTEDPRDLQEAARGFAADVGAMINTWEQRLRSLSRAGKKIVLWGSGSKAVAFLTKLSPDFPIEYIVDINPHKWETYSAGTGQRIVSPDFLRCYQPDVVVAMNPFYAKEIEGSLRSLGVPAELLQLT
jgi:SAM-dependent methyltransferase